MVIGGGSRGNFEVGGDCSGDNGEVVIFVVEVEIEMVMMKVVELVWEDVVEVEKVTIMVEFVEMEVVMVKVEVNVLVVKMAGGGSGGGWLR